MPSALVPLANITLGSSAATVTFSSISGSYRDLMLVSDLVSSTGTIVQQIRFNSDSGANYSHVYMAGTGSTTDSASASGNTYVYAAAWNYLQTSTRWFSTMNILDYSATDKHKPILIRSTQATTSSEAFAARWANTSAITTITITASSNAFGVGSTFALYGVSA